jgi:L-threonylcarbamoyladenylate synthase
MKTETVKINPCHPEKSVLQRVVDVVMAGGVVVMPTDTVYGLAASAFNRAAASRIFRLKGRSYRKPLIVMPPDIPSLACIADISSDARKIMEEFWPGPLTLVLPATTLGRLVMGGRTDIGARIPGSSVVHSLLKLFGAPLITTSANPSSKPSATNARTASRYFNGKVDLIIDAGPAPIGRESTVIDMVKFPYIVLREGSLPSKSLLSRL